MTDNPDSDSVRALGLDEAYSVKTPDDNRRLYAKWAATYESEFVEKEKYRYPRAVAEVFADAVISQEMIRVVDIGTGTGLTGTYLTALRENLMVDGIDISPEMLAEARRKKRLDGTWVYHDLFVRDLTKPVTTPNAPYDALISSGTFTHGHLGPTAIDNLIPFVRSGGSVVIGVNNEHFVAQGFDAKLKQLISENLIGEPDIVKIHVYEEESVHYGDQARVVIFKVL